MCYIIFQEAFLFCNKEAQRYGNNDRISFRNSYIILLLGDLIYFYQPTKMSWEILQILKRRIEVSGYQRIQVSLSSASRWQEDKSQRVWKGCHGEGNPCQKGLSQLLHCEGQTDHLHRGTKKRWRTFPVGLWLLHETRRKLLRPFPPVSMEPVLWCLPRSRPLGLDLTGHWVLRTKVQRLRNFGLD